MFFFTKTIGYFIEKNHKNIHKMNQLYLKIKAHSSLNRDLESLKKS
jgi:hypothetical protein